MSETSRPRNKNRLARSSATAVLMGVTLGLTGVAGPADASEDSNPTTQQVVSESKPKTFRILNDTASIEIVRPASSHDGLLSHVRVTGSDGGVRDFDGIYGYVELTDESAPDLLAAVTVNASKTGLPGTSYASASGGSFYVEYYRKTGKNQHELVYSVGD